MKCQGRAPTWEGPLKAALAHITSPGYHTELLAQSHLPRRLWFSAASVCLQHSVVPSQIWRVSLVVI